MIANIKLTDWVRENEPSYVKIYGSTGRVVSEKESQND